jgi:cAMP phosphodiesterase
VGLEKPFASAQANAAYITRTLIDTHLITHPHLDHISAFVVNTAGLQGPRPKRIAALPTTIDAFKNHIFNNVIWPNLSDENDGAGLVTYLRLVDGGSPALGFGEGRGYIEICEGLSVKTWSISHGHCIERHIHRGSNAGLDPSSSRPEPPARRTSLSGFHTQVPPRSQSTPVIAAAPESDPVCVYNSSAFFICDIATGREVLIFGDVEPDSISFLPRNKQVWSEAARKFVAGRLGGIFIECSFDDSTTTDRLYGHLAPRFLMEELRVLADEVENLRDPVKDEDVENKKRKRLSNGHDTDLLRSPRRNKASLSSSSSPARTSARLRVSQRAGSQEESASIRMKEEPTSLTGQSLLTIRSKNLPLKGLRIVIIHVKDKLTDGRQVGENVLAELKTHEKEARLGCTFIISEPGQAVYL